MMNNKRMMPLLLGATALLMAITSQAGTPVWTFTPLTPTTLSIPSNETATVQYQVTNHSTKSHTLAMSPINGVAQNTSVGYCENPFHLSAHQSCVLNLRINGPTIPGSFSGGPVVCEQGSELQCYQPDALNVLNITKSEAVYTVGGMVNGLLGTLILDNNDSDPLMLTTDGPFIFPTTTLSGASYSITVQTQPATQTCTVHNGSGTIINSNISDVTVTCSTNAYTVGGNTAIGSSKNHYLEKYRPLYSS